jgi:hypothetical protein
MSYIDNTITNTVTIDASGTGGNSGVYASPVTITNSGAVSVSSGNAVVNGADPGGTNVTLVNAGAVIQTGTGARGGNAYEFFGLTGGAGGGGTAAIILSQGGTIDNSGAIAGGAGGGAGAGDYGGTGGIGGAGIVLLQPGSIDNNGGTITGGRGGAGGNAFIYSYYGGGTPGFLPGFGGTGVPGSPCRRAERS